LHICKKSVAARRQLCNYTPVGGAYRTARLAKASIKMANKTTKTAAATPALGNGTHVTTLAQAITALGMQPAALPNNVSLGNNALVVVGPGVYCCKNTYNGFLANNGGAGGVAIVHLQGQHIVNLPGQTSPVGTTRGNCLAAAQNGHTISAARQAAKFGPPKNGKPQKPGTKPGIVSSLQAQLQGTYNPGKYPMAKPAIVLVATNK
jgi:hypothetical protein